MANRSVLELGAAYHTPPSLKVAPTDSDKVNAAGMPHDIKWYTPSHRSTPSSFNRNTYHAPHRVNTRYDNHTVGESSVPDTRCARCTRSRHWTPA